mgnify:CR=1 FL=1
MSEQGGKVEGGAPIVRPADSVERQVVGAGKATAMQVLLGPREGAPNFALRRFTMGEGGGMPFHTNEVEHEQYVLRGRARVRIGDQIHEVGPDHTLYMPAGAPHSYEVVEAPFEFLCVVPNRPDSIRILEESASPEES